MDQGRAADDALAATLTGARGSTAAVAPRAMFGRYLVIGALGKGGMGEVFTAYDPELDRKVALKRVQVDTIERADRRARLLREAQAMAKIRHPNVIAVFDVGQIDDEVFIAMELVDGEPLRAWLRREHTTTAIVEAFLQAARGLAAAHELGLVHRDFKPDNVMVDRSGRVQVLDFGLVASTIDESTTPDRGADDVTGVLTRSHATVGTPAYMAPEQHAGTGADELSDQFALCVALFEGLHGARPFQGETLQSLATAVLAGTLIEPTRRRAIPRWLDRAVRRGLAVDPRERWPSMRELISALEQGMHAERRSKRRWLVLGALAVICGAGALALAPDHACDDAARPVDDVWGTSTRERLATAFGESPTPLGRSSWPAIEAAIEARAEGLRASYRQVCADAQAGDRAAVERADRGRVCLHGQTNALASALEVLAIADADVIEHAPAIVAGLPEAQVCIAAALPPITAPIDPMLADRVHRGAALAAALLRANKAVQAKATVEGLLAEPAVAGDPASAARLGVLAAESERALGNDRAASDRLDTAYLAARGADSREPMLAVANEYVARHLDRREPIVALQWIARARVEAEALGDTRELAVLDGKEARALYHRGEFEQAIALSERSLDELAALGLADSADAVDIKSNLGGYYFAQKRFDRAAAIKREAIEQQTRVHGPEHPRTAAAIADLGVIESTTGDLVNARAHLEQALGILERALVEPHPRIGDTLAQLAGVLLREGDTEGAIAAGERALANLTPSEQDSSAVALVLNNHSLALLRAGRRTEAIAVQRRSVAMKERVLPASHPDLALAYSNLAELLSGEAGHDPAEITALYRESLAIRSARDDAEALAHARALLAAWLAEQDEVAEPRSLAQLVLDEPTATALDRIAAVYALARAATGPERRTHARDALALADVERSEFLGKLRALAED